MDQIVKSHDGKVDPTAKLSRDSPDAAEAIERDSSRKFKQGVGRW